MLDPDLANRFVERISTCTDYNINIMNESGVIIASRDTGRIGSYHETAHQIIKSGQDMIAVKDSENYLGVKSGVNLLVHDGKRPVGVVGVTGDPEKVQEIALIIKMALESMLRYEQQRENLYSTRTTQERFCASIFIEENPEHEKLEELAVSLQLNPRRIRIPILLSFSEGRKNTFDHVSAASSRQDIIWTKDSQHILIYKDLGDGSKETLGIWRNEIEDYLRRLAAACHYAHAFVGTMQCRLRYYKQGLSHCCWLERNVLSESRDIFFMDYINRYIPSLLPTDELHNIWNVYDHCLSQETKADIRRIVEPLLKSNYNMVSASQELFIHKNTLAFQMNKLRTLLNIDPFRSGTDRLFLNCLYYYLKRNN